MPATEVTMAKGEGMIYKKFYNCGKAKFIGGYYTPPHEKIDEDLDEIYCENMLFFDEEKDQFILVHNKWYFYVSHCYIIRSSEIISEKALADFISEKSMECNWTTYLIDIMYNTGLNEEQIYFEESITDK